MWSGQGNNVNNSATFSATFFAILETHTRVSRACHVTNSQGIAMSLNLCKDNKWECCDYWLTLAWSGLLVSRACSKFTNSSSLFHWKQDVQSFYLIVTCLHYTSFLLKIYINRNCHLVGVMKCLFIYCQCSPLFFTNCCARCYMVLSGVTMCYYMLPGVFGLFLDTQV